MSTSSHDFHSKQSIVIIGGGNAGINAARSLSEILPLSNFDITLITERTYHIHYPARKRYVSHNLR